MEVEGNDSVPRSLHRDSSTNSTHASNYSQVSNFVDEYIDRERGKNNIIVYNLPENNPEHPE